MKIKISLYIFCICLALRGYSQTVVQFDTDTASEWTVSGGGAQGVTPFVIENYPEGNPSSYYDFLSVTSTGDSTGTFLQGGSLADFSGFWVVDYTFTLPSTATNISLDYGDFFADDRAVLALNGQVVDSTGIISIEGAPGSMVFTDGGDLQPYSFNGPFSSGTLDSGFNVGGSNTLEVIVNNTGTGTYGPDKDISPGDTTLLGLSGTISYSEVPEPNSIVLLGFGILVCAWHRNKQMT
jgi:hypothetical protein